MTELLEDYSYFSKESRERANWGKSPAFTGAKGQLRRTVAIIPPANKSGRTVCAPNCGCNACSLMGAALAGKINVA